MASQHASASGPSSIPWRAINKQQPTPSFVLPSLHMQAGLRKRVRQEQIDSACNDFKSQKDEYEQQCYRESIFVPICVDQNHIPLEEARMHAHIVQHGRQSLNPPSHIAESIAHEDFGEPMRGGSCSRAPGGSLYERKQVTGKVGGVFSPTSELSRKGTFSLLEEAAGKNVAASPVDRPQVLPLGAGARGSWTPGAFDKSPPTPMSLAESVRKAEEWGARQAAREPDGEVPVLTAALALSARGAGPGPGGAFSSRLSARVTGSGQGGALSSRPRERYNGLSATWARSGPEKIAAQARKWENVAQANQVVQGARSEAPSMEHAATFIYPPASAGGAPPPAIQRWRMR